VNAETAAGWSALAFLAWRLITSPAGAWHGVHDTGVFLSATAHAISAFFTSL
jgi:hypothetical protein